MDHLGAICWFLVFNGSDVDNIPLPIIDDVPSSLVECEVNLSISAIGLLLLSPDCFVFVYFIIWFNFLLTNTNSYNLICKYDKCGFNKIKNITKVINISYIKL